MDRTASPVIRQPQWDRAASPAMGRLRQAVIRRRESAYDRHTGFYHDCGRRRGDDAHALPAVHLLSAGPEDAEIRELLLVVYCLRNVNFTGGSFGIPEIIAVLVVIITFVWKRQMLLSMASGTLLYMLLVQTVFK